MTEHFESIRENLNAPSELVDAVAKGEPYRSGAHRGDSKRRHVKRFAVAIAAYVCIAMLLVSAVMLLPKIFEEEPQPADTKDEEITRGDPDPVTPETVTSPRAFFNALLDADEVIVTSTETVKAEWTDGEATATYTLDGSLIAMESPYIVTYYDFANQKAYSKYADTDWIVTDTNGASWENTLGDIFGMVPYVFEDDNYEQKDGKYVFTEEAVDRMLDEYDYYAELIVLTVGEPFETEITFEQTDEGAVWNIHYWSEEGYSMSTVIDVRYTDTTVTLPDEVADAKPLEDENKKYTPDLLYDAFDSGSDVTVSAERMGLKGDKITEQTTVYERDGDKIRMTEQSDLGETVRYLDMATGLEYYADAGGWLAKGTDCTYWNGVMWDYIFGIEPNFLFDSSNYVYNNGSYNLTDEACETLSATLSGYATINETFGDSVDVSTMIAHYSDGITESWEVEKFISSRNGSEWESVRYTITFSDTTVTLPGEQTEGDNPLVSWFADQSANYTHIFTQYRHQAEGKQYLGGAMTAYPDEHIEKVEQIIELLTTLQIERVSEGYATADGDMLYVLLSDAHPTRDKIDLSFTLQGRYLIFSESACYMISQSDADRLAGLLTNDYGKDRSFDLLAEVLTDDPDYGGLKEISLGTKGEVLYVGLPRSRFDLIESLSDHLTSIDRTQVDWRVATAATLPTEASSELSIVFNYNSIEVREPLTVTLYGRYLRVNNNDDLQWFELSQADADRLVSLSQAIIDGAG